MKTSIQTILFSIAIFLQINVLQAQESWIRFETKDELSFSVEVPGEMERTEETFKTAVGELNVINYAFQGKEEDPNYLYLINMVQYPDGTFPSDSIDLIKSYLTNSIESSIDKVEGELIYSSEIEQGAGQLFRIKYNNGDAIIKGKSLLIKDVFVSLQVFTIEQRSLNDEMDVFLDSFRIGF